MSEKPKVGIIILNWNNYEDSSECIDSLKELNYMNYEVYLVDNNSSDDSFVRLKKKYKEVHFVKNAENFGFAGGVNSGIKKAIENNCHYVWLVNNDAKIVNPSALSALVDVCENDNNVGVAGSLIKFPTGEIQFSGGNIKLPLVKGAHKEENLENIYETEYVTGCSMLIPKKTLDEIGLMNEDYFLYFEDADYCRKISRAGYKCVVVPDSILEHELGGTSQKNPSLNYIYYNLRNRFLYAFRWLGREQLIFFIILTTIETLLRGIRYIFLGRIESLRFLLQAFWDGLMKKQGKYKLYTAEHKGN